MIKPEVWECWIRPPTKPFPFSTPKQVLQTEYKTISKNYRKKKRQVWLIWVSCWTFLNCMQTPGQEGTQDWTGGYTGCYIGTDPSTQIPNSCKGHQEGQLTFTQSKAIFKACLSQLQNKAHCKVTFSRIITVIKFYPINKKNFLMQKLIV